MIGLAFCIITGSIILVTVCGVIFLIKIMGEIEHNGSHPD